MSRFIGMKHRFPFPRWMADLALVGALLALSACGGGGDSQASSSPTGNSSNGVSSSQGNNSSAAANINTPTGLQASRIGSTKVALMWDTPATGTPVTAYRLRRNGQLISTVSGDITQYTDTGLEADSQYAYRIQAGDANGNWSSLSTSINVRTAPPGNDWIDTPNSSSASSNSSAANSSAVSSNASNSNAASSSSQSSTGGVTDRTAPTVPAGLAATTIKDTTIDLVWEAARDNVGVTLYRITRDGVILASVSGRSLTFLDRDLQPDTTYTYQVQAGDAAGNWSNLSARLQVATVPVISGTRLSWSHPTQRENGQYLELHEIGGYEIRYRENSLDNFTSIQLPGSNTTQYSLGSIPSNYDFQIAVYDTQGLYSDYVLIVPH